MIGPAIFSRLSNDATVSALVQDRILPEYSPERLYPQINYDLRTGSSVTTFDNGGQLASVEAEIACIGQDYDSVAATARAVFSSLDNQSGTWGGIHVQGAFMDQMQDDKYLDADNEGSLLYVTTLTFTFWITT